MVPFISPFKSLALIDKAGLCLAVLGCVTVLVSFILAPLTYPNLISIQVFGCGGGLMLLSLLFLAARAFYLIERKYD